ncbi:MAG: ribosome maturation factor RimP [Nitrospiraceae bacterium]
MEPGAFRNVLDRARAVAEPIVRALALELVDVECAGQGAGMVLRVFIDKPGGVTVHDCEQVHLSLGHALDVEDLMAHAYTLEVSSPGLDRPLKRREDYAKALGKQVNLRLRLPWEGQWRVVGRLLDVNEQGLTLAVQAAKPRGPRHRALSEPSLQASVEWDAIAAGRLDVEW